MRKFEHFRVLMAILIICCIVRTSFHLHCLRFR